MKFWRVTEKSHRSEFTESLNFFIFDKVKLNKVTYNVWGKSLILITVSAQGIIFCTCTFYKYILQYSDTCPKALSGKLQLEQMILFFFYQQLGISHCSFTCFQRGEMISWVDFEGNKQCLKAELRLQGCFVW